MCYTDDVSLSASKEAVERMKKMKKRILCLAVTLCLLIALLPVTALAATPTASLYFLNINESKYIGSSCQIKTTYGIYWFTGGNLTTQVKDGSLNDDSESYVKFDLSGTIPTLVLKNVDIKNLFGLTLGGSTSASETTTHTTPYNVVLIGENTIEATHANYGPLEFMTTGDKNLNKLNVAKYITLKNNFANHQYNLEWHDYYEDINISYDSTFNITKKD